MYLLSAVLCFNLCVLPLFSILCLLAFLCQTRGGRNFRESRGLSSSTVDLYTGNWAAGGQVAADLSADLLTDPKMLLPSARSRSHNDHKQHYQTASAYDSHFPCLSASDPKTRFLQPKDILTHLHICLFTKLVCCFFFFKVCFEFRLLLRERSLYVSLIIFPTLVSPQCLLNVAS